MKFLETKIPPPAVMALFALAMWGLARVTPSFSILALVSFWGSKLFLAAGLVVLFLSAINFIRARTTFNPMAPQNAATLVTSGLYSFSRNPIYVADVLFLISWGLYLANPFALALILLFMAYITRFQIEPEERALSEKFGPDYAAYKKRVRRWL